MKMVIYGFSSSTCQTLADIKSVYGAELSGSPLLQGRDGTGLSQIDLKALIAEEARRLATDVEAKVIGTKKQQKEAIERWAPEAAKESAKKDSANAIADLVRRNRLLPSSCQFPLIGQPKASARGQTWTEAALVEVLHVCHAFRSVLLGALGSAAPTAVRGRTISKSALLDAVRKHPGRLLGRLLGSQRPSTLNNISFLPSPLDGSTGPSTVPCDKQRDAIMHQGELSRSSRVKPIHDWSELTLLASVSLPSLYLQDELRVGPRTDAQHERQDALLDEAMQQGELSRSSRVKPIHDWSELTLLASVSLPSLYLQDELRVGPRTDAQHERQDALLDEAMQQGELSRSSRVKPIHDWSELTLLASVSLPSLYLQDELRVGPRTDAQHERQDALLDEAMQQGELSRSSQVMAIYDWSELILLPSHSSPAHQH